MENSYRKSVLDTTEVLPPVPPATHEAPTAEPGAGAGGGAEDKPPTASVSPGRDDFSGIKGSSSDDSRTSSGNSSSNNSEDLSTLVRRPARDLESFGELPALQSGRTRSESRGLIISASCADALLTYSLKTVRAKGAVEEEPAELERAHDSLLEERLENERE